MRLFTLLLLCLLFPAINGCSKLEPNPAEPPAPVISVTSPGAGDVWSAGTSYTIAWQSTGLSGDYLRIELFNDSGVVRTIAENLPDNDSLAWTLPLNLPAGSRYRIVIATKSVDPVYGTGDIFTIVNHHDAYEPDSSASYATSIDTGKTAQQHTLSRNDIDWFRFRAVKGATYCIQTFGSTDTYLRLYAMAAKGSLVQLSGDNDGGIGPNALIAWSCVSSGTYYFSVSGNTRSNSLPYSVSLSAGGAVCVITYPTAGLMFKGGDTSSVEWSHSSNSGATVSLHLYRNDTLLRAIGQKTPNNGYFTWTIPYTLPSSPHYRIKIVSDSDTSTSNFSGYFSITNDPFLFTVNTPSAYSAWNAGDSYSICWTAAGNPGCCASLELYHDTTLIATIAKLVTLADRCHQWLIPRTLTTSARYRIRITGLADPMVSGFSEPFLIVNNPVSLTVIAPGATTKWRAGSVDTIRWVSAGSPGPFARLQLFDGTSPVSIIAENVSLVEIESYYGWSIPENLPASSQYRIKITCIADTSFSDLSDPFTITGIPPAITVSAPGTGTVWNAGSPCTVKWTSAGPIGDTLRLGLYRDSVLAQPLISSASGSGTLTFHLSPSLEGGNRYQIRIQSSASPSVAGYSGWFTIVPVPVSVSVTSPNSFSSWITGSTIDILWLSSGPPGSMARIDLYDSSSFVQTISAQASISGNAYQWTVPFSLHTSDRYRIKISSTPIDTVTTFSEPFTITHQSATISITAPAAGASWNAGTIRSIVWNSSSNVPGSFVIIDIYDSATFVAAISSGVSRAAGAYTWTLPATLKGSTRYRIKIASAADSSVYAYSGSFTIVQQPNTLTITAPVSSDSWSAGSYYTIYWSYTGTPGSSVKLDLYDSSAFIRTISPGAYTAGASFLWLVPPTLPPGNKYRIKIQSVSMDTVLDHSDYFSIAISGTNDAYEPDSSFSLAKPIAKGSPAQTHHLTLNDHDWFSLTAAGNTTYTIETTGATDTYLDLFSTNGTTLLLSDDDSGSLRINAKIVWTPASGGVYFFRIKGSAGAIGEYSVSVR